MLLNTVLFSFYSPLSHEQSRRLEGIQRSCVKVARSSKNILENIVLLTIFGAERDTQPVLDVGLAAQRLMVNVCRREVCNH